MVEAQKEQSESPKKLMPAEKPGIMQGIRSLVDAVRLKVGRLQPADILKREGVLRDEDSGEYTFQQALPVELLGKIRAATTSYEIKNNGSLTVLLKSGEEVNIKRPKEEGYSPGRETVQAINARRLSLKNIVSSRTFSDPGEGAREARADFLEAKDLKSGFQLFKTVAKKVEEHHPIKNNNPNIEELEGEVESIICAAGHTINLEKVIEALQNDESLQIPQLDNLGITREQFIDYLKASLEVDKSLVDVAAIEASIGNILSKNLPVSDSGLTFLSENFEKACRSMLDIFEGINFQSLGAYGEKMEQYKMALNTSIQSVFKQLERKSTKKALIEIEKVFVFAAGIDSHFKSYLAGISEPGEPWAHYLIQKS